MILDEKQIADITLGALEIYRDGDGIYRFKRMTDAQAAEFTRENSDFENKTQATSGVRFDFYTDSDYVEIRFAGVKKGSSRRWYSFDLFVNGKLRTTYQSETYDINSGVICTKLEKGENRLQLFFPCLWNGGIEAVELADGATVKPAKPARRMLTLGDSITQGYDAHLSSATYANIMARELDAEMVNQAIGGAMFYKEQLEYTGDYDIVTVAYGTNDWSNKPSFEVFCNDCEEYFKRLSELYPDARKFAILPIYRAHWNKPKPAGNFYDCRKAVAERAEKYGIIALESIDYVSHDEIYFEDLTLHPNDIGFATYAKKLLADMRRYL